MRAFLFCDFALHIKKFRFTVYALQKNISTEYPVPVCIQQGFLQNFVIGNQRELIRDFVAERPELHLVGEYADDGYTGTNFEQPGFTQMIRILTMLPWGKLIQENFA